MVNKEDAFFLLCWESESTNQMRTEQTNKLEDVGMRRRGHVQYVLAILCSWLCVVVLDKNASISPLEATHARFTRYRELGIRVSINRNLPQSCLIQRLSLVDMPILSWGFMVVCDRYLDWSTYKYG